MWTSLASLRDVLGLAVLVTHLQPLAGDPLAQM